GTAGAAGGIECRAFPTTALQITTTSNTPRRVSDIRVSRVYTRFITIGVFTREYPGITVGMMQALNRGLKLFLLVVALVFLVGAIWPEARLAIVWAAGRCKGCTFRDSIRSHNLLVEMARAGEQIGAASKVIEKDPQGFELVETPMGRYWTQPR